MRLAAEHFPRVILHHAPDAIQAQRFLRRLPPYAQAPVPHLVLLDLRMPLADGTLVLEVMKGSASYRHIPVVVFTSSTLPADYERCKELEATAYLLKPADWAEWLDITERIFETYLKGFRTSIAPTGL
jgi:two-component system response regulator